MSPRQHQTITLLTTEQVAKILGIGEPAVTKRFRQRQIPGAFKSGSEWRIRDSTLERWIEDQERGRDGRRPGDGTP